MLFRAQSYERLLLIKVAFFIKSSIYLFELNSDSLSYYMLENSFGDLLRFQKLNRNSKQTNIGDDYEELLC
jgi:hypothetical protein